MMNGLVYIPQQEMKIESAEWSTIPWTNGNNIFESYDKWKELNKDRKRLQTML